MIEVRCEGCGRTSECASFLAGLTVLCKGCGHGVPVPGGQPGTRPPSTPATGPAEAVAPRPVTPEPASPPPPARKVLPEPVPEALALPSGLGATPLNERAQAMLDAGLPMPTVVQRLVGLGQPPEVAEALVVKLLDERALRERARQKLSEEPPLLASPTNWLFFKLRSMWWGQLLLCVVFLGLAVMTYQEFSALERGEEVRIFIVLLALYTVLGKWGMVLLFVGVGGWFGWKGVQNLLHPPDR